MEKENRELSVDLLTSAELTGNTVTYTLTTFSSHFTILPSSRHLHCCRDQWNGGI